MEHENTLSAWLVWAYVLGESLTDSYRPSHAVRKRPVIQTPTDRLWAARNAGERALGSDAVGAS